MHSGSTVLVTGSAGFIGFHLVQKLCLLGFTVTGIDNINDYYDVDLKKSRLNILKKLDSFTFQKLDISNHRAVQTLFDKHKFDYVVNLAAQAGVRYSLTNPQAYVKSNLEGFVNILEGCRSSNVKHLVYASSSSVYGANRKMPFSTHDNVDHPISLYAVSKKSNELMAHAYSSLFNLPTTGLRFFTVYGPYGRPDMALFIFTKAIMEGKPIDIYNEGRMRRDFTYVDDIVEGVSRLVTHIPQRNDQWNAMSPDPSTSAAPYKIYNIGNNEPVELMRFVEILEEKLGKKAIKNLMPIQDGDVPATYADIDDLIRDVGFKPSTPIEVGIDNFVQWYLKFYK